MLFFAEEKQIYLYTIDTQITSLSHTKYSEEENKEHETKFKSDLYNLFTDILQKTVVGSISRS